MFENSTASIEDTATNQLSSVADRYPEASCPAQPGDVIFFHGNILHRSFENRGVTARRAFVGHYCDARSFVPWHFGEEWEGMNEGISANEHHILCRGDTHLAFGQSRFGTPCAAMEQRKPRMAGPLVAMPMGSKDGVTMGAVDVTRRDEH